MILRISRSSKRLIAVLSQYRKPSQIAWGVAIGIMLGLIPKDNLIAVLLVLVLACLRVNQLVACVTGLSLSLLGGWFSPITGVVGTSLLGQPMMANCIASLYRFPLIPWTCLDNALVMGGIGVGTMMLVPAYVVCLWGFSQVNQKLESIALEQVANDAIQYRKSVTDQTTNRQNKPAKFKLILNDATTIDAEPTSEQHAPVQFHAALDVAKPAMESVASKKSESRIFGGPAKNRNQRNIPTIFTGEVLPDGNDTFLRETVIEVVRYRRPAIVANESIKQDKDSNALSQTQGISMTVGNASTLEPKIKASDSTASLTKVTGSGQSITFDSSHHPSESVKGDESLKYLLWHINGSRDSARKSSEKSA